MDTLQIKQRVKLFIKENDWKLWPKIIMLVGMVILVVFDQMIKLLAQKHLSGDTEYKFLPGFINFKLMFNFGSAFGKNQGQTAALIAIAFVIIFVLLTWFTFSKSITNIVGIIFILSGTIGNLTDRFLHNGGVVDFIAWDMFEPKTVFNTADIMINVGIIIIVLHLVVAFIISIVNSHREKKMEMQQNGKK